MRLATGSSSDANFNPEHSPLLPDRSGPHTTVTSEKTGLSFYTCLFSQPLFVIGTISYFVFSVVCASFDTTLPLHVRSVFNWGSLPSGLLFIGMSGPSVVLAPVMGWWKDRIGTRIPVTIGFLGLVPLLWLVGVPGDDRFSWANQGHRGEVIYAVTVTAIGIMTTFLSGAGTMEATRMLSPLVPPV